VDSKNYGKKKKKALKGGTDLQGRWQGEGGTWAGRGERLFSREIEREVDRTTWTRGTGKRKNVKGLTVRKEEHFWDAPGGVSGGPSLLMGGKRQGKVLLNKPGKACERLEAFWERVHERKVLL